MSEVVASSLVRLVCNKMATQLMKEYGLFSGANKELKKLEGTLKTIRDVLEDAEARQEKEKALRGWLKKLKDVAFEIDDLLDDAASEARRLEKKKKPGIKGKVCKLSSAPHSIKVRFNFAHKAKAIREKLDEIAAERSKFHLQEKITTEGNGEDSMVRESSSFVIESEVYGREQDKNRIIDLLINTGSENNIGFISIVGMGGLGKTTIAQLVYNDERVQEHFKNNLIWVSVNNNFDIQRIIKSILQLGSVTESNSDSNLELLQHKLKERLGGQRFLLVLDDVWNENSEKWDRLRALLTIGNQGSKVMVTTRSTRVSSIMGIVSPYIIAGLSEEDCWLLFEKRAFTLGKSEANSNLVTIGKQIVKKCGGVPLAAKVLGSLMRFKRRESEWLAIRDNSILNMPNVQNEILPSLRLSYICLPSHLKMCFSYCALFPKNETILTSDLIQLWIAEGFIQPSSREKLEDVGMEYVEELLARSLFQVGWPYDGTIVTDIEMHDLIHDLANYVASEECSIVDTSGITNITENTRYSSFVCKNGPVIDTLKSLKLIPSNLRTLYLVPSADNRNYENEHQKDFLNYVFSKLILLRALYLSSYHIIELPTSLGKLAHLRYLNLSRARLEELPPDIGHLPNLTTLLLVRCSRLKTLPDTIGELSNLIKLDLSFCVNLCSLPDSVGQLRSLQDLDLTCCRHIECLPESIAKLINLESLRLKYVILHELPSKIREMKSLVHLDLEPTLKCIPCGIGDLCQLRSMPIFLPGGRTKCSIAELGKLDLKDKLVIKNLENVQKQEEAKEANLILKNDLRDLTLSWNLHAYTNHEENTSDTEEQEKSMYEICEFLAKQEYNTDIVAQIEQILENLQPPNMLSNLKIEGYLGKILPKWLMHLQLPNLVHLTLESCFNCETLPKLEKLRSLKTLELNGLTAVHSLNSIGQIPSLEVLKLYYLPLVKCLDWEFYGGDVAFTRLVELELTFLLELEEWSEVAAGLESFPSLYKLTIGMCPKLKKLPSTFCTVGCLGMCVDDQLLLDSLCLGGFPNLKDMKLLRNNEDVPLREVIVERLQAIESWSIGPYAWLHNIPMIFLRK